MKRNFLIVVWISEIELCHHGHGPCGSIFIVDSRFWSTSCVGWSVGGISRNGKWYIDESISFILFLLVFEHAPRSNRLRISFFFSVFLNVSNKLIFNFYRPNKCVAHFFSIDCLWLVLRNECVHTIADKLIHRERKNRRPKIEKVKKRICINGISYWFRFFRIYSIQQKRRKMKLTFLIELLLVLIIIAFAASKPLESANGKFGDLFYLPIYVFLSWSCWRWNKRNLRG